MWGTPLVFCLNQTLRKAGGGELFIWRQKALFSVLVLWQWQASIVQTSSRHERWDQRWKNFRRMKEVLLFDGDVPGVKNNRAEVGAGDLITCLWYSTAGYEMFGDCNDDVNDDYCDVNVDDCNIYDCHVNFCDYDLTHSWSLPRRYGEGTDRNEEALEASFNSSTKSSCTNVQM